MNDIVLTAYLKARLLVNRFLYDESGDANIVSIVIVIGIVVMLAALFRKQITTLVNDLLENIVKDGTDAGSTTK